MSLFGRAHAGITEEWLSTYHRRRCATQCQWRTCRTPRRHRRAPRPHRAGPPLRPRRRPTRRLPPCGIYSALRTCMRREGACPRNGPGKTRPPCTSHCCSRRRLCPSRRQTRDIQLSAWRACMARPSALDLPRRRLRPQRSPCGG